MSCCLTIAPILVGGGSSRIVTGLGTAARPRCGAAICSRRRRLPVHALRHGPTARTQSVPWSSMRRRRLAPGPGPVDVVVGVRRRLLARPGRQSALRDRLRRAGRRARRQTTKPPTARRRSRRRRTICRGGTARRGSSATPPCSRCRGVTAGLRQLRRRPRSDQQRHRNREHRRGAGARGADTAGRRAAGDDHGSGSAVVDAAADVAVPRRRRRAQDASDRGGRPSRHRHLGRAGLPRPVRPPGDARPGAVRSGDDPVANLGAHHADRHHQLHRAPSRPATRPTTTRTPPRTSNGCAASGTMPTIALLGIGNGAQVASLTPDRTPTRSRGWCSTLPAAARRSQPRPRWSNASRANRPRWTPGPRSASPPNCPLAPDPKGAIDACCRPRETADGPGRCGGGRRSPTPSPPALAYPRAIGSTPATTSAAAVAAARSATPTEMTNLITAAEALRQTDGQFVNCCSDCTETGRPRTGSASSWSPGASSTHSSACRRRAQSGQVPELAERIGAAGPEGPQDSGAAARCAERPDRRQRGRRRRRPRPSSTPARRASG